MKPSEKQNSTACSNLEEAVATTKAVVPKSEAADPKPAAESVSSAIGIPDISALRLPQNYADTILVKKRPVVMQVRKPHRQEFVRVHPGPEYQIQTMLLTIKGERNGTYLVAPDLWQIMPDEVVPHSLVLAVSRQGGPFIWGLRLPRTDRGQDLWTTSALEAAKIAREQWVSVRSNMAAGTYDVFEAPGNLGEPEWPDITFQQALDLAFRDHFIADPVHPVLRQLRGEV